MNQKITVVARITLFALSQLTAGYARAEILPVCERTGPVQTFIVNKINQDQRTQKTCAEITDADLETLKRVAVNDKKITQFRVGDFSGLPNLEILNIKGNPITELPAGLLADLPKLTTLVLFRTKLQALPDDFLEDMPNLSELIIFTNPFTTIPEPVYERLAALQNPKQFEFNQALTPADKDRLTQIFAGRNVDLSFR